MVEMMRRLQAEDDLRVVDQAAVGGGLIDSKDRGRWLRERRRVAYPGERHAEREPSVGGHVEALAKRGIIVRD